MASVAVLAGSASDLKILRPCLDTLEELGISFTVAISSAHRSPQRTEAIVADALRSGALAFICAAGMAAHLAGAVAARTCRPVIGLPIAGETLGGMDALLSTVQMPAGFPVATVALNGAKNAAWLAAQIIALNDPELEKRLMEARRKMAEAVESASAEIAAEFQKK